MILVADDNVAVRNLLYDTLTHFGYGVILAVDGQDAVDKFVEHKDATRLVLLDVIMPKKNGVAAYQEIRRLSSDVKVLLLSGYTAEIIQNPKDLDGTVEFIKKPFNSFALVAKIAEMLGDSTKGNDLLTT